MKSRQDQIAEHYLSVWKGTCNECVLTRGPVTELPEDFCVLEFPPSGERSHWTYATACMSQPDDARPIELHLHSPFQSDDAVILLTVTAHYHRTGCQIGLGHSVNFGRPWIVGSQCEFGFISLPYLDGPTLERLQLLHNSSGVRCLWLIPITLAERDYKKSNGVEALEQRFEDFGLDYLNPMRDSVTLSAC